MKNMLWQKSTLTLMAAGLVASMGSIAAARAADCPRKDALGTSRILAVDAATKRGNDMIEALRALTPERMREMERSFRALAIERSAPDPFARWR